MGLWGVGTLCNSHEPCTHLFSYCPFLCTCSAGAVDDCINREKLKVSQIDSHGVSQVGLCTDITTPQVSHHCQWHRACSINTCDRTPMSCALSLGHKEIEESDINKVNSLQIQILVATNWTPTHPGRYPTSQRPTPSSSCPPHSWLSASARCRICPALPSTWCDPLSACRSCPGRGWSRFGRAARKQRRILLSTWCFIGFVTWRHTAKAQTATNAASISYRFSLGYSSVISLIGLLRNTNVLYR